MGENRSPMVKLAEKQLRNSNKGGRHRRFLALKPIGMRKVD